MPWPPSDYPFINDDVPGDGTGTEIDADHINAPIERLLAHEAVGFSPATHAHPVSEIDATGTRSSTTYLSGNGTWSVPAGGGGGTGAAPALIIAASDSTSLAQGRADIVCDGSDDQDTINAAIIAANNQFGGGSAGDQYGSVLLCDGTYNVTGPILLPSRGFSFGGLGQAAVIFCTVSSGSFATGGRGSEKALIKIANDATGLNANSLRIHDLFLDVDYDSTICGISLSQTTEPGGTPAEYGYPRVVNAPDSGHSIYNVRVFYAKYGIHMESSSGGRACHIESCYISGVYSAGVYVSASDAYIANTVVITAAADGAHGFDIHGGSTRLVGNKASYLARSGSKGFDLTSSRVMVVGCEAQDCTIGFDVDSADAILAGCRADTQVAASGSWVDPDIGFDFSTGTRNVLAQACHVITRGGTGWDIGINLTSGSEYCMIDAIVDDGCVDSAVAKSGTGIASSAELPTNFTGSILVQHEGLYTDAGGASSGGGSSITRVGGAANAANFTEVEVTLPSVVDNDIAVACIVYNQAVDSPATPSGWTLLQFGGNDYVEYSASMQARVYWKVLEESDSSVTFTSATQKLAGAVEVFRGVRGIDVYEGIASAVTPSATLTTEGVIVSFGCERSSSPSTAVSSAPSGMTEGASAFNVGGGAASIATAYQHLIQQSGVFNPGDWSFNNSQPGVISFTVALKA